MGEYKVRVSDGGSMDRFLNGMYHCDTGPAMEDARDHRAWLIGGRFHREDGPAIEYLDGTKMWYIDGKRITEEDFCKRSKGINTRLE